VDKFYITYPYHTDKRNCYSVVEATSYDEAYEIAVNAIGNSWAFMYTEEQFMGKPNGLGIKYPSQIETYNLTEIPLES
jgi:hypothetical protein